MRFGVRHSLVCKVSGSMSVHIALALSVVFCTAQGTEQESVSELIGRLSSDNEDIWRSAVLPLAMMEDRAVLPVAEAVRADQVYDFKARLVYENLTSHAARQKLIELLQNPDEKIGMIAVEALGKHGDRSAVPAWLAR